MKYLFIAIVPVIAFISYVFGYLALGGEELKRKPKWQWNEVIYVDGEKRIRYSLHLYQSAVISMTIVIIVHIFLGKIGYVSLGCYIISAILILMLVAYRFRYSEVFSYLYNSRMPHIVSGTWHNDTTIKYIGRCPSCNRELDYGCRPIGGTYQCIHCNCVYKLTGD
jgi:hypothetical protein